jgi:ubiquinone/menaquinone biosynthesis C-methylase UbiE
MTSTEKRIMINETEFHDRAFKEFIRSGQAKYYSISQICFEHYKNIVLTNCRNKAVLEIGCGIESHAILFASQGALVTGIDISLVALKIIQQEIFGQTLENRITFVQMDAQNMTFEDNSFDIVCGRGILHHLNIDSTCREVLRVLRPGGKAVFLEPLGHNPFINFYRKLTPKQRTEDEHPLSNADIKKISDIFGSIKVNYFNLITLLATPFRNLFLFHKLLLILSKIDSFLFRAMPFLKSWAWIITIYVQKSDE